MKKKNVQLENLHPCYTKSFLVDRSLDSSNLK